MHRRAQLPLFIALLSLAFSSSAQPVWNWVRVEGGLPAAVIMQGTGSTVSERQGELVVRLTESSGSVDVFDVRVARSGKKATIEFQPPNTERGIVRMSGTTRTTKLQPLRTTANKSTMSMHEPPRELSKRFGNRLQDLAPNAKQCIEHALIQRGMPT